jgi:hypothetical protein
MKRMRVELALDKDTAQRQVRVLMKLGYNVTEPESAEIVWVSDASKANTLPLVTYADPGDRQVWIVIGKQN